MRLTTIILDALNALKTAEKVASVVYNSPFKTNVELDTTTHPVAVLYLFRDGAVDIANGIIRELADVNVLFLTHQPQLDFDGVSNEALLDDMAEVAASFLAELNASNAVEFDTDVITLKGIYDYNDKNTTGVSLQFRLRETQGQCLSSYIIDEPTDDEHNEADTDEGDNTPVE